MLRRLPIVFLLPVLAAALHGTALAQAAPGESADDVSADNDILSALNRYDLTADQLGKILPLLRGLDEKQQALEAYKHTEEALAPLRALRQAHLKGSPTNDLEKAAEPIWTKLQELGSAFEDAVPEVTDQVIKLLTNEQLAMAAQSDDIAAEETDALLTGLEEARGYDEAAFATWRDQQTADLAARLAPEDRNQAAQLQKSLQDFLDRGRKLNAEEYARQSDKLFDELHGLVAGAAPKPTRDIAEEQAREAVESVVRSLRTTPLIEAMLKARA